MQLISKSAPIIGSNESGHSDFRDTSHPNGYGVDLVGNLKFERVKKFLENIMTLLHDRHGVIFDPPRAKSAGKGQRLLYSYSIEPVPGAFDAKDAGFFIAWNPKVSNRLNIGIAIKDRRPVKQIYGRFKRTFELMSMLSHGKYKIMNEVFPLGLHKFFEFTKDEYLKNSNLDEEMADACAVEIWKYITDVGKTWETAEGLLSQYDSTPNRNDFKRHL